MRFDGFLRRIALSSRVVRAVLCSPALRRVEGAFLLFNAAEFGTWVAIPLFAYEATGPASVGVVALIQLLPAAIVAPLAANLGDRYRRDRVLFVGYLVQALAYGMTTVAMVAGWPAPVVYLGAASVAASLTITRPTQGALLPSVSRTPEELTAANGLSGTVEGTGLLLGPLLAAGILVVATPAAVFVAGTVACTAAAVLVARLPMPARPVDVVEGAPASLVADPSRHDGLLAGVRTVAAAGDTRLVVGILALRMVTSGALDVLFVLLALEVLGDAGDAYYVLESGGLAVTQGGRQLRTVVERGDGVGEIALLRDVPRTATVTAISPSVLLMLGRADFLEAVTGHPQAGETARRVAAERSMTTPI